MELWIKVWQIKEWFKVNALTVWIGRRSGYNFTGSQSETALLAASWFHMKCSDFSESFTYIFVCTLRGLWSSENENIPESRSSRSTSGIFDWTIGWFDPLCQTQNSILTAETLEHKLVQQVSALNYSALFVTPNCLGFNGCREKILAFCDISLIQI